MAGVMMSEEQPLLAQVSTPCDPESNIKQDLLDFEPGDPEDPTNWSPLFKWFIVLLLACMAFTVTFTCIGVVPIAKQIVEDLDGKHATSSSSALLVTIWELGEAAGPLLIAPLSEVFGRYPVVNICNIAFIGATLLAMGSQSSSVFILARMLTGLTVASNVLSSVIIGDMFKTEQRGSPMSLVMIAPLLGGATGPFFGGSIAQAFGWRYILVVSATLAIACEVLLLTCSAETYKLAILRRRATRHQDENRQLEDPLQESEKQDSVLKLRQSITRPFSVLFSSCVLILLATFGSVTFSIFYIMSVSLPNILEDQYGLTPAESGTVFMYFSLGSFLCVLVCNFSLDRIYVRLRRGSGGTGKPEYHLPLSIIGALSLPFSVAAYGWAAQWQLPLPFLYVTLVVLGFTLLLAFLPVNAYVVDACGVYSASAMTGVIVTRCLMGTFLPLTTGPLVQSLGYGIAFSVIGALCLCSAAIPILVLIYGGKWRQHSGNGAKRRKTILTTRQQNESLALLEDG